MRLRSSLWGPCLALIVASLHAADPTPAELFFKLQAAADQSTPEHVRARLASPLVDAQLRQIPRDKVEFNAKPYAELLFKKGVGFRLMVRHVDDYFARKLGSFEELLEQAGLFVGIGRRNTWALFNRAWELSYLGAEEGGGHRLRVRERDGVPGDYGIYTVSTGWLLQKSEFYEGSQVRATLALTWQKVGEYQLVSGIQLTVRDDRKLEKLSAQLADYKFEPIQAAEFRGR